MSEDFFALGEVACCVNAGIFRSDFGGRTVRASVAEGLTVVSVVFQVDVLPRSMHIRVIAALGGATETLGLVEAGECFVLLKYNELGELISADLVDRIYD